jgi:hypothetical protein
MKLSATPESSSAKFSGFRAARRFDCVALTALQIYWIVTVKVIELTGVPLLAVPVRVAVVLPLGPVPEPLPEPLLLLLLLPPLQAASPIISAKAARAKVALDQSRLRRLFDLLAKRFARIRPRTSAISASPVDRPVFQWRPDGVSQLAEVVLTVTVTGTLAVLAVNTTEAGLKPQVAPAGRPEHAKFTVPL